MVAGGLWPTAHAASRLQRRAQGRRGEEPGHLSAIEQPYQPILIATGEGAKAAPVAFDELIQPGSKARVVPLAARRRAGPALA